MKIDVTYLLDTMKRLLATPSPTGYYKEMIPVIEHLAADLGYTVTYDNRKNAYITVPGEIGDKTVCVSAHADTLGLMVRGVNSNGTLRVRALGGVNFISCEGENVTVHTRSGKTVTGSFICTHHSTHAYADAKTLERNEDTMCVLLDAPVKNAADVAALGIMNGDYISIEARVTVTENGYVKSRFLDNKVAMACVFATLKALADNGQKPKYNTVFVFPFYEEIGLGGVFVPTGISEYVAVDIAILGPDSAGSEHGVTICAKDAAMPYDYDLTNALVEKAARAGCRYAVDLFFRYGSDASQAVKAGNDVCAAAFGMGVYCSHGAERTHIDGILDTAKLLMAYVLDA